jgi:hypothetical protein
MNRAYLFLVIIVSAKLHGTKNSSYVTEQKTDKSLVRSSSMHDIISKFSLSLSLPRISSADSLCCSSRSVSPTLQCENDPQLLDKLIRDKYLQDLSHKLKEFRILRRKAHTVARNLERVLDKVVERLLHTRNATILIDRYNKLAQEHEYYLEKWETTERAIALLHETVDNFNEELYGNPINNFAGKRF